jgi:hypothetical protein
MSRIDLDALIAQTRPAARRGRASAGEPDVRAILLLAAEAGDFHPVEKAAWLKAAKGLLVRLAAELDLPRAATTITVNEAGPAVGGGASLTAPGLYVSVYESGIFGQTGGAILVRGADAADPYGTRYTNTWPGRDWVSLVTSCRNTLRRPMKARGGLNRPGARTVAWTLLPRDMQVLLGDFAEDGYGLESETRSAPPRGAPSDLVVRPVPIAPLLRNLYLDEDDRGSKHVAKLAARLRELLPGAADRRDPDRVMAALLAPDPRCDGEVAIPPIVTRHGRFADGRHRMFAAREVGITHLPAVEMDEWLGPEGSAAALPESPEMLHLKKVATIRAAKLRAAGTPEGARHAKWEWEHFRHARGEAIDTRRHRAYEEASQPRWTDWKRLSTSEPYLYHFTHYGQLRGIAREGLVSSDVGGAEGLAGSTGCVFLTTPGGFPQWAAWASAEADYCFEVEGPARRLVVLRVRTDRLDPSRLDLDRGGTKDARVYPPQLVGPADPSTAVAVCHRGPIPPDALEVARVHAEPSPTRWRPHRQRLVFDGPWVPVARLARGSPARADDPLPAGTVLYHGHEATDRGLRVPALMSTNTASWERHRRRPLAVVRYETTRAPTRVLVASGYEDAIAHLGSVLYPRTVDAAADRELARLARAAGYEAVVIRWPALPDADVWIFARDLLGPGTRVYPGIPRITGRG